MSGGLDTASRTPVVGEEATGTRGPGVWLLVITSVALVALAYAANRSQPRPATVYLDDAWALMGARAHHLIDFRRAAYTAFGFVLLQRLWLDLVSFSAAHARLLTMAFTFAAAPAFLVAAVRMRIRYAAGLLGAVVLVISPELVSMGTHVKQYSLDVLFGIALTALAAGILRAPGATRRWVGFGVVAVAALFCSFAIVGVVAAGLLAGLLAVAIRHGIRSRETLVGVLVSGAVGLFAGVWFLLVLRPIIPTDALNHFWRGFYLDPHQRSHSVTLLRWLFRNGFALPLSAAVVILGIATLVVAIRRPLHAVLFGTPVLVAIGAALAKQAPIGSGRTDTWFYVPMVFMVVSAVDIGLHALTGLSTHDDSRSSTRAGVVAAAGVGVLAVALAVGFVVRGFPGGPDAYGGSVFVRQPDPIHLMDRLEAQRGPDDLVIASPVLTFLYPLYGRNAIVTHPTNGNVAGWYPVPRGLDLMLPYNFEFDRAALDQRLQGKRDVWLLDAPHSPYSIGSAVRRELEQQGFTIVAKQHEADSSLEHWRRAR